jgi:hypothetical protein
MDGFKFSVPKSFEEWWKTHRTKTLRDLQIEALEWTIAEEEKRPKDYSVEERSELRQMLKELRQSKEALKPGWPFAR